MKDTVCTPFDCLVLDLRYLILNQLQDMLQDLVLHRLVSVEVSRVLFDLRHQVCQAHIPRAQNASEILCMARILGGRRTYGPGREIASALTLIKDIMGTVLVLRHAFSIRLFIKYVFVILEDQLRLSRVCK